MSKLFSEVYGCYFNVVRRILNRAIDGIKKEEMDDIVATHGFSETAFHLLPKLLNGNWPLLEKRGDLYFSKLENKNNRPITQLELSWLSALLKDPRIKLFLSEDRFAELSHDLRDIAPAFNTADIIPIDQHLDGDPYSDATYIANFKEILNACKHNYPIVVTYDSEKTGRRERTYHPFRLSYSELNDKFRLRCGAFSKKTQTLNRVTLNSSKIVSVKPSDAPYRVTQEDLLALFSAANDNPPIIVEISKERNALDRFLLQFASFDRYTEYDSARDLYICKISYDMADETELLIRVLSFGPTIKVVSPQSFIDQIKERIHKQLQFLDAWSVE